MDYVKNFRRTAYKGFQNCFIFKIVKNQATLSNVPNPLKDVDLSNANRGVWLVKVPKYIADR